MPIKRPVVPRAPKGTPIVDKDGNLSRSWEMYLIQRLPFIGHRVLDLYDLTVGNDIAPHQYCFMTGWVPPHIGTVYAGPGRRIVGQLRKTIAADLTVRFNNVTQGIVIGSITIPSATTTTVTVLGPDITGITFRDLDVFTVDITASDGSSDVNGVASFTIEWTGTIG